MPRRLPKKSRGRPRTRGPETPVWSAEDSRLARKEGWDLFTEHGGTGSVQLQRLDEAEKFEDDSGAWSHVLTRALNGSRRHRHALNYLKIHNPTEYRMITKPENEKVPEPVEWSKS